MSFDSSDFLKKIQRLEKVYSSLPSRSATIAVNFSKERFLQQNWVDNRTEPWKPRKENKKGRKRNQGRAILVKTGRLKRDIRKLRTGPNFAVVGTNVPYAPAHNYGDTIKKQVNVKEHSRRQGRSVRTTVKSHVRQMNVTLPRRQFIGASTVLARRIERQLTADILNALK